MQLVVVLQVVALQIVALQVVALHVVAPGTAGGGGCAAVADIGAAALA